MDARQARGEALASRYPVAQKVSGLWEVPSESRPTKYLVDIRGPAARCSCPDFDERRSDCKHIHAVRYAIERAGRGEPSPVPPDPLPPKARPTYRQNWKAYNLAQVNEKSKFSCILSDLCRNVPEPPARPGPGRKPLRLADLIFCVTSKVYSTVSARRFMSDLADAHARGYIAKVPHFNAISKTLESPALTPILRGLIEEGARPLKAVEVDFAVDSSGFTTSRFVRWFDHKYGQPRHEYDWVKCHLMCGVKTNIVTAVEIGKQYDADCPRFAPMVRATVGTFTLRDVSADAAYLSYDNMELIDLFGGTPYIAFKANTTAAQGGILSKMFHLYNFRRDDFLDHYHKRSNVESTFSMVKAKFGDHLRSKTDIAMVNEALCKILCHNICVLIQSHYELGIAAEFWGTGAEPEPIEAPRPAPEIDELISMCTWM